MKKLFLLLITISSFAFSGASVGSSLMMITLDTGGYGDVKMNIPTLNGGFSGREGNFGWEAKLGVGLTEGSDDDNDGDEWTIEIDRFIQLKGKYFFQENFYGALVYSDASIKGCLLGTCAEDDDSDTGFHLGYLVNENIEIYGGSVLDIDGSEVWEFGFSYSF